MVIGSENLLRSAVENVLRNAVRYTAERTVVCIDPKQLAKDFARRAFDETMLAELPASVDPCGENGEFHTFAWDGPVFQWPIRTRPGQVVERDGFVFADVAWSR